MSGQVLKLRLYFEGDALKSIRNFLMKFLQKLAGRVCRKKSNDLYQTSVLKNMVHNLHNGFLNEYPVSLLDG